MTKVEEVARALAVADGMHPDAVSNDEDEVPVWTLYVKDARAAIEAMKGLPDNLAAIVAFGSYTDYSYGGDDGSFEYFSADNAKAVWDDLIDAALAQPTDHISPAPEQKPQEPR